jgi:hypothetical protein
MMTIVQQLEYDLKELDVLHARREESSSFSYEMINYVHAQKSLIEEFSKFLKLEIAFADTV